MEGRSGVLLALNYESGTDISEIPHLVDAKDTTISRVCFRVIHPRRTRWISTAAQRNACSADKRKRINRTFRENGPEEPQASPINRTRKRSQETSHQQHHARRIKSNFVISLDCVRMAATCTFLSIALVQSILSLRSFIETRPTYAVMLLTLLHA